MDLECIVVYRECGSQFSTNIRLSNIPSIFMSITDIKASWEEPKISGDDDCTTILAILVEGKGCIFSNGEKTGGKKFCSKSVRELIEDINKRQSMFNFIDL